MSTQDNNGAAPAFPIPRDPLRLRCDGLNKREYAAIEMAKGLLSGPEQMTMPDSVKAVADAPNSSSEQVLSALMRHISHVAFGYADALLAKPAPSEPPASPSPTEGEALGVLRELMDVVEDILLPRITSSSELEIRKEPRAEDIFRRVDALLSQCKGGGSDV